MDEAGRRRPLFDAVRRGDSKGKGRESRMDQGQHRLKHDFVALKEREEKLSERRQLRFEEKVEYELLTRTNECSFLVMSVGHCPQMIHLFIFVTSPFYLYHVVTVFWSGRIIFLTRGGNGLEIHASTICTSFECILDFPSK